jgi:CheY-like chemotaxis protein
MKPQILVIDDSKAIRFLLQTILGKKYQVIAAADAASAMFWLSKKNFPALIITEAELPGMNNWEFAQNIRNSFTYGDIPMVVLSSLPMAELQQKTSVLRIEQYFVKPFNPIHLIEKVDQLVYERNPSSPEMIRMSEAV